jgi:hypothetical protein
MYEKYALGSKPSPSGTDDNVQEQIGQSKHFVHLKKIIKLKIMVRICEPVLIQLCFGAGHVVIKAGRAVKRIHLIKY